MSALAIWPAWVATAIWRPRATACWRAACSSALGTPAGVDAGGAGAGLADRATGDGIAVADPRRAGAGLADGDIGRAGDGIAVADPGRAGEGLAARALGDDALGVGTAKPWFGADAGREDGQPGDGDGEGIGEREAGWPAPCDAAGANCVRGPGGTDEDH